MGDLLQDCRTCAIDTWQNIPNASIISVSKTCANGTGYSIDSERRPYNYIKVQRQGMADRRGCTSQTAEVDEQPLQWRLLSE